MEDGQFVGLATYTEAATSTGTSTVVSIGLFLSHFVHFGTMEYITTYKASASDVIVSQKRFQWRRKVAFLWGGGTIILLALFVQRYPVNTTYNNKIVQWRLLMGKFARHRIAFKIF